MRYVVQSGDPAFHPAVMHMTVTLNGVKVERCVEVDDTAGIVRVLVGVDDQGKDVIETRRGVVRIQVPHEHATWPGWPAIPAKYVGRPIFQAPRGILRAR